MQVTASVVCDCPASIPGVEGTEKGHPGLLLCVRERDVGRPASRSAALGSATNTTRRRGRRGAPFQALAAGNVIAGSHTRPRGAGRAGIGDSPENGAILIIEKGATARHFGPGSGAGGPEGDGSPALDPLSLTVTVPHDVGPARGAVPPTHRPCLPSHTLEETGVLAPNRYVFTSANRRCGLFAGS
jgi:hypothetical protein